MACGDSSWDYGGSPRILFGCLFACCLCQAVCLHRCHSQLLASSNCQLIALFCQWRNSSSVKLMQLNLDLIAWVVFRPAFEICSEFMQLCLSQILSSKTVAVLWFRLLLPNSSQFSLKCLPPKSPLFCAVL